MRCAGWALVLLLTGGMAMAGQHFRGELADYGRYAELTRDPYGFDGTSIAGYSSVVKAELLERTTRVPLRLGELFGFNYAIEDGSASGEWIPVRIEISHPPATDYRGRPSRSFVIDSAARLYPDGRYRNGAFYRFSEHRELLPGRWRISVIYRGRKLVSQEFVVAADAGAAKESARGSESMGQGGP